MRTLRLTLLLAPLLATSGCFGAIAGLDSYTFGGDAGFDGGGGPLDLTYKFNNFTPHAMIADPQIVVSNIVDSENYVRAVVIYDPFPFGRTNDQVMGRLTGALDPTQTYVGHTWADIDGNRMDTPDMQHGGVAGTDLGSDHSWLDPIGPDGFLDIEHPDASHNANSNRMNSPDRGNVLFTATNIALHLHVIVVLILTDTSDERTVGYYRFKAEMGVIPLGFRDVAVAGHGYTLTATIDMNSDDLPSADEPSSSMNATAGMPGEDVTFTFDIDNFH